MGKKHSRHKSEVFKAELSFSELPEEIDISGVNYEVNKRIEKSRAIVTHRNSSQSTYTFRELQIRANKNDEEAIFILGVFTEALEKEVSQIHEKGNLT